MDGTLVDNGCHGLSVDLEYQLLGRPKYAIVMETGREILHELGAPSHARRFQILVSFGWILLQADVVVVWILDLGDVDLEMVFSSQLFRNKVILESPHIPQSTVQNQWVGWCSPRRFLEVLEVVGSMSG